MNELNENDFCSIWETKIEKRDPALLWYSDIDDGIEQSMMLAVGRYFLDLVRYYDGKDWGCWQDMPSIYQHNRAYSYVHIWWS